MISRATVFVVVLLPIKHKHKHICRRALTTGTVAFAFVAAGVMLHSRVALASASEPICEGSSDVTIEGQPTERWSDVLGRVCADVTKLHDRDPNARVKLIASEDDLIVEVTLADGRSAIRRVKRPLALHNALEALLTLPPTRPSARDPDVVVGSPTPSLKSDPSTSNITNASSADSSLHDSSRNDSARNDSSRNGRARDADDRVVNAGTADVALSAVGRVAGAGFLSVGGAAEAYLTSGHWLFGLYARWDAYQTVSAPRRFDYEIDTLGAGVAVVRRFQLRPLGAELDLGFSPRLLVETESAELPSREPSTEPGDETDDETRTSTDVRLAPFARVLFGRQALRFFAGLDGEISPARLRRKVRFETGLPALPAWSAGLSAGVSWSAP